MNEHSETSDNTTADITSDTAPTAKKSGRGHGIFMTLLGLSLLVLTIGYSVSLVADKFQPPAQVSENSAAAEGGSAKDENKEDKQSKQGTSRANNPSKSKKGQKAGKRAGKKASNSMASGKKSRKKLRDKDAGPPYVKTLPIKLGSNRITFDATGRIAAKNTLTVNSDVAGEIVKLHANLEAGELVKKGDLLAKIDPANLSRQLTAAKARLVQAQASLQQEQARAKQAKIDLKRSGIKRPSALALRKPQLASANASITSINAEIADLRKDLKNVTITSPINGMVLMRKAQLGNQVGQNTPIVDLIDIDMMTVAIALTKQELLWLGTGAIREKQSLSLTLDESPQQRWQATLSRLSPQVDSKTQSLTVYADLPKPYATVPANQTLLRVGSAVNVNFSGRSVPSSAWIDTVAIQEGKYVWTVDADNTLQRADVIIIKTNDVINEQSTKQTLVTFPASVKNYVPNARTSFTKGLRVSTTLPVPKPPAEQKKAASDEENEAENAQ